MKERSANKGCVGCALFGLGGFLILSVGFGYLFYIEETALADHSNLIIGPISVLPNEAFVLEQTFDGTGYAHHDYWLAIDVPISQRTDFRIGGNFGCYPLGGIPTVQTFAIDSEKFNVDFSTPSTEADIRYEDSAHPTINANLGPSRFTAWVRIGSEYDKANSSPIRCTGSAMATRFDVRMHVFATRSQRPSDLVAY